MNEEGMINEALLPFLFVSESLVPDFHACAMTEGAPSAAEKGPCVCLPVRTWRSFLDSYLLSIDSVPEASLTLEKHLKDLMRQVASLIIPIVSTGPLK